MKKILIAFSIAIFVTSCSSYKKALKKQTDPILSSTFYQNQFTGLLVFDPENRDTLYAYQSKKYFTPASNTKIFTLFASLQLLPDKVPTLKYWQQGKKLYVQGTGDPAALHPYFNDSTALNFLKRHANIELDLNNLEGEKLGQGWAWDDYDYYYQPEMTPMPLYGNVVSISRTKVMPEFFKGNVVRNWHRRNRDLEKNTFYVAPSRRDTVEIPYRTDSVLTKKLLEAALNKNISLGKPAYTPKKETLYGIPTDSLYVRMMHESDNFIAEQLLILASSTLSDTLSGKKTRDYVLENYLQDLRQAPRWVDGSGLSRYNLFTPEAMVNVLDKLYQSVARKRLFAIFPENGVSGTLKGWDYDGGVPKLYAKSGSLSNNYCLSGYLITQSGKTLIFSFMNNHYRQPASEVKKRMQQVLRQIAETY
ncbi:D-alanyl-D-alanine carboxypeptidase/D-alanyl-D-alanine-endopeptidase [Zobellia uliginosa]|uniref:D-alanyl-D-alanine carboxypeptidase/D-alanyl-D-alanine-endopeptidase n=1 Tax=Zobellia uliginosa TaxID=143224 RepID=UPI0026E1B1E8|nr:D-alanyl-D-alanine carboxypeptidase [Zobellia uliginosa]MDO6517215.1 D-alanyl-D-alanine carboxypeptidase [Zobellia uliginosa]